MEVRLKTKKSTIPGAGDGLFTLDDIPANAVLFPSFTWNGGTSGIFEIDYEQSPLNSKVNHSIYPNLISFWKGNVMYKKTLHPIKAGEELLSDYRQTMRIIPPGYRLNKSFLDFKTS